MLIRGQDARSTFYGNGGASFRRHSALACFDHVGQEATDPTADLCRLENPIYLLTASLQKMGSTVA
jgi:hypothetical protein